MKLAVVIPSYNHAHYIRNAIGSCLRQSQPPDRIIVIDDGSKDDSLEVIREFEKDGVELTAQENAGAHNTINRAVAKAAENCDLISILNSDDHYMPRRFEKCLPFFDEHPDKSVVCTELNIIDDDDGPLAEDESRAKWFQAIWSIGDNPEVDFCEWLGMANFPATTSNIIARADYLLTNPFRPYRFNHDYFFLAKAVIEDRFGLIREPLVNYRVHATNTITTEPAPLMREMLRMHLDLYREFSGRLEHEPKLRTNFFRYMRSAGDNVSSFHAGLFQMLLARLAGKASEEELEKLAAELGEGEELSELSSFPNKALVNAHTGDAPLSVRSGLADRYEELRAEKTGLKADKDALRELARLRQRLLGSRWAAFGRFLGFARGLDTDSGKSPEEKLGLLRKRVEQSKWLRIGRTLGWWKDSEA